MATFLSPLLRAAAPPHVLVNVRTGRVVAARLVLAFDSKSRRKGLLEHGSLPDGSAMIIAPTNAIHTFFMKFAIDVLFVARDGTVTGVREALPPWRIAIARRAHCAIELAAGSVGRSGTRRGDRLSVREAGPAR